MKPNISEWTIVVIGNWNVAILNPDWVCEKIFEEKEISIEVLLGAGQAGLKMVSGTTQLIPSPDRVIIAASSTTTIDEAEKATVRLLDNLPITPVSSIGVNFGFFEPEPMPELLSLFDLRDKPLISSEGWDISETSVIRRIKLDDKTLNLRLTHNERGISFHLNFHWDVATPKEAMTIVEGKVALLRDEARSILKKIYNVEEESVQ